MPIYFIMNLDIQLEDVGKIGEATLALLLSASDGIKGEIRFQKVAFLLDRLFDDEELKTEFDFIPHDFGPWSEALKDTIDRMEVFGLISKQSNRKAQYSLTPTGRSLANEILKKNPSILRTASTVNNDFKQFSDDDIIGAVYELYPEYTTGSLIRDEIKACGYSDSLVIPIEIEKKRMPTEIKSRCGKKFLAEFKDGKIVVMEM
jgi:uncharacterized protein YwgA